MTEDYQALTINGIMDRMAVATRLVGFRDVERPFPVDIALMHSELSEALEEYRNQDVNIIDIRYEDIKPIGIAVELADTLLRILETCAHYNIPIEKALSEKMEYNEQRSYRHGGKCI